MSASVFGAAAAVTMLNRAFNNASPANAVFNNQVATAGTTEASQFAFATTFAQGFASLSNADLASRVMGNLGMLPNDALLAAFTDYLAANGAGSRGVIVLQLSQILSTMENATGDLAIYAPQAVAWNKEVEKSFIYSSSASSTTTYNGDFPDTPANVGQTFTLTSGADQADTTGSSKNGGLITSDFKFTSANETVTAVAGTLAAGDVLADGSTTDADVLNATITAAGATAVSVANIETINLDVKTATGGLDMASVAGAKVVSVNTNTGIAAQVINIAPSTAPVVELKGSGVLTANFTSFAGTTAAGTAESASFKFNGAATSGANVPGLTLTATAAGTLETLNLESAGSTKNTVALTSANAIGKAVVTGGADFELRAVAGTLNGVELNGSAHTASLTVSADFDGGAAVVGLNAEKYTGVDTYVVRDTAATLGATGFGLFNIANGTTVRLADDIAAASIITVSGSAASTADSLNLLLQNRAAVATDIDVTGTLTINNVETIKLTSTGAPTTGDTQSSLTIGADKLSTLTLDGGSDLAVTLAAGSITAANTAAISIDGSAATGKLAIVAGNIANTGTGTRTVTIKSGTNDDVITGASTVAVKNVFDLTAGGKDTVNLNIGDTNDSIISFANGDKIALGAVAGTFVNGLAATNISAANQAVIEAAADVAAAATAAAAAGNAHGGVAVNAALLFSYQGNQYILMNEDTVNAYDAASDAIVQVTGLTSTTTFDAGTFLFAV